jgi:Transglutaminase-like superfamily
MILLLCRAYLELIRLEHPLLRKDFAFIHQLVRSCPTTAVQSNLAVQAQTLRAMDVAAVFYFKEVKCLQRSAATTRLLRKQGIRAEMIVGVQHLPFRAHAWVEIDGVIVNDKPYIGEMYAVLERC